MPIRRENAVLYPADWPEIRHAILGRAKNRCEWCGVENHVEGVRDEKGTFFPDPTPLPGKRFRIVLTIMHLDHNPANCDAANLRAACQRCHNRYDCTARQSGKRLRRRQAIESVQLSLIDRKID